MTKQTVLITGASSGFGYLTVLAFAKKGYRVIATMRDLSNSDDLIEEAKGLGLHEQISVMQLDVTNQTDIDQVKHKLDQQQIIIDVLINNAGFCQGGPVELVDMDKWRQQFEANVFGVIAVTKAFLPDMRKRRSGKIIMLSSISGRFGFPALGPYTSSKFALEGFSESLRLEMLPFGVYVSLVEPGPYRTKIWEKGMKEAGIDGEEECSSFVQTLLASAAHSARKSGDPKKVVQRLVAIANKPKPKLRYPIGLSTRVLIMGKLFLPWSLIEWMVRYKLKM
ncbi:SDR family oxidoreductase [Alkalicoccobacillus porphyridii]|uniref:SDR family oxidoreductase n=1 Tax=Alkalicoccobacillus porphyridii TaxID=2597270 RepID=A0A553ZTN5_9BACI|nr:SDR family oxidoreductase [Alkalicoccobacillus porphyridii]TSB44705.1 SDR family oxidoreductase [Alkalicoccobacillus porphyridii]